MLSRDVEPGPLLTPSLVGSGIPLNQHPDDQPLTGMDQSDWMLLV